MTNEINNVSDNKQYLTQKKFNEFVNELKDLKLNRRKEIADQLEYARSLGDLSENAEYKEARELQSALEGRIDVLESILADAQVIKSAQSDAINIGSKVSIMKVGEKEEREYEVVGSAEANMRERKVSHMSPLGSAMMGKKKGQFFGFETPSGVMKYKIVSVS